MKPAKSGTNGARAPQTCLGGDAAQRFSALQHHDVHIRAREVFIEAELDGRGAKDRQRLSAIGQCLMHGGKERIEHLTCKRVPAGRWRRPVHGCEMGCS